MTDPARAATGAVALLVLCGPQEVTKMLFSGLWAASAGRRSFWALLQLVVFLLVVLLLLPVLAITGRQLRRAEPGSAVHGALRARQNWYTAAVTAWAVSLVIGFVLSYLIRVAL